MNNQSNRNEQPIQCQRIFVFNDYKCDGCFVTPIKHKMYQCNVCPDFTYCIQCYQNPNTTHEHQNFTQLKATQLPRQTNIQNNQINYNIYQQNNFNHNQNNTQNVWDLKKKQLQNKVLKQMVQQIDNLNHQLQSDKNQNHGKNNHIPQPNTQYNPYITQQNYYTHYNPYQNQKCLYGYNKMAQSQSTQHINPYYEAQNMNKTNPYSYSTNQHHNQSHNQQIQNKQLVQNIFQLKKMAANITTKINIDNIKSNFSDFMINDCYKVREDVQGNYSTAQMKAEVWVLAMNAKLKKHKFYIKHQFGKVLVNVAPV